MQRCVQIVMFKGSRKPSRKDIGMDMSRIFRDPDAKKIGANRVKNRSIRFWIALTPKTLALKNSGVNFPDFRRHSDCF